MKWYFLLLLLIKATAFVVTVPGAPRQSMFRLQESIRPAIDWVKSESFEDLVPRDDAQQIVAELLSDESLIDDSEKLVRANWGKLEQRLQSETRSIQELLGDETTDRLLKAVAKLNEYDPEAVKTFLESDAINNLFSRVLYDGIFEFFQRIDVFGNIINGLPIIGPIRKQIITETKKQLDRSLGPLVQNFLKTYTLIAVIQASDYILSPSNRNAFGSANQKLLQSVLGRPINSLLPPGEMSEKILASGFEYVRKAEGAQFETYIDWVYDLLGDKSVDGFVDTDRILDASPTLKKTLDKLWTKATDNGGMSTE